MSVITICKDNIQGILRTLESVQTQENVTLEWIVVDGDSTDGTAEAVSKWLKKTDVLISESDQGVYDAMNKGLKVAGGDIIVFLNSGDTFADKSTLSRVAKLWSNGEWEWAYGGQFYVDEEGQTLQEMIPKDFDWRSMCLGFSFAPHQSTYVSKSLYDQSGPFDLDFDFAADQEMAIKLGANHKPFVIKDSLARFEVGGLHQSTSYFRREKIYHRIRAKHSCLIFNNTAIDLCFTFFVAFYREIRERSSDLIRKLLLKKPNKVR